MIMIHAEDVHAWFGKRLKPMTCCTWPVNKTPPKADIVINYAMNMTYINIKIRYTREYMHK